MGATKTSFMSADIPKKAKGTKKNGVYDLRKASRRGGLRKKNKRVKRRMKPAPQRPKRRSLLLFGTGKEKEGPKMKMGGSFHHSVSLLMLYALAERQMMGKKKEQR